MPRVPSDPDIAAITSALASAKSAVRSLEAALRYANGAATEIDLIEVLSEAEQDCTAARRALRGLLRGWET